MKRIFLTILCVSLVVLSVTGRASALTYNTTGDVTGDAFSGYYLFTVTDPQNDNLWNWDETEREAFIGAINDSIFELEGITNYISELEFYGKYDFDEGEFDDKGVEFDVSPEEGGSYGSWATLDGTLIDFYAVKGATEFAVYWLGVEGASSGLWSTEHLSNPGGNPDISHLSLWNPTSGTPQTPIPEPSTVFLLGLGLLGIVGVGRKFKK